MTRETLESKLNERRKTRISELNVFVSLTKEKKRGEEFLPQVDHLFLISTFETADVTEKSNEPNFSRLSIYIDE